MPLDSTGIVVSKMTGTWTQLETERRTRRLGLSHHVLFSLVELYKAEGGSWHARGGSTAFKKGFRALKCFLLYLSSSLEFLFIVQSTGYWNISIFPPCAVPSQYVLSCRGFPSNIGNIAFLQTAHATGLVCRLARR